MLLQRGADGPSRGALPWPPILTSRGRGAASSPHAHHAMHLVLAIEGTLSVEVEGRLFHGAGVLTKPDVHHAIDAAGADVFLIFADPESDVGGRIRASLTDPVRVVTDDERRTLLEQLPASADPRSLADWGERAFFIMAGEPSAARTMHPRVRRVIAHLRTRDDAEEASLADLAKIAGLSEGRLAHAFTQSVGVPIRRYVLWLKLQRAAGLLLSGATMTDAALAGGFADAAHMSRTFRKMFGMKPSEIRSGVRG